MRRAAQLLSFRFFLAQLILVVFVSLLTAWWLRVQDAGPADVLLTLLLGVLILLAAFGGESFVLLRLRPAATRRRWILGAVALLVATLLWLGWSTLLEHLSRHDMLWAGYLHSRAPASTRNFFLYTRWIAWFGWLWAVLKLVGAGTLLAAALSGILQALRVHIVARVLRSWLYWTVLALAAFVGTAVTHALVQWMPGRGLPAELFSFAARMSFVFCFDLLLACLVFATVAAVLEREAYPAPAGTPELSQPRTTRSP